MRKLLILNAIIVFAVAAACSTTYQVYRNDLFEGRNLLNQGDYGKARDVFVKASTEEKRAAPFALAATASYKMNDLPAAESLISEAEKMEGKAFFYLRITGFKALIYFKENRKGEGLDALNKYLEYYRHLYPLMNIEDVEAMAKSGDIKLPELERLLDEQITTYERDVTQAVTMGTGFYSRRPIGGGRGFMPD
jgi:hypothetical protein